MYQRYPTFTHLPANVISLIYFTDEPVIQSVVPVVESTFIDDCNK